MAEDKIAQGLLADYITPHLRSGEAVQLWLSSAASTRAFARILDALGPAIFVEAWFSRPTIVAFTGQRLVLSAVTVLRDELTVEAIEDADIKAVTRSRSLAHDHVSIQTTDNRRFRITVTTWSPFNGQPDALNELFQVLASNRSLQPA